MPRLFYPFDAAAFWRRLGTTSLLGGMAILIGVLVLTINLGVPHKIVGGLTIPPMLLLLVWDIALPLFVRQRIEDGLRIDENGLSRTVTGRTESWRWSDVSDFRLHGRWHPMRLFIGRSISFRGPRPARRSRLAGLLNRIAFGGSNMAFGNNYLVVSEELADRLNRYRDVATGAAPRPATGHQPQPPEPALFIARESLDAGKRSKAVLILAGTTLASAALLAGIVMWSDRALPESVEEFVNSDGIFAIVLPAFLILMQSLSQHFWQSSPATNLIVAAAGGLFSRRGQDRKLWRWDEIADIAVKAAPPEKGRETNETVSFAAIHDGTRPGKPAADAEAGALVSAFDDAYDAPPREIARRLETWADWGRAHAGPVTPEAIGAAGTTARPMTAAIRYQRQGARPSGALRTPAYIAFLLLQLGDFAALLAFFLLIRDGVYDPVLYVAGLGVMFLLLIGSFVILLLAVAGSFNYLEIGPAGLDYRRLGWRHRYGWHELAPFELHSARLRWSSTQRSIVLCAVPRDDRLSRYMRWAYRIGGLQPRVVIEDVYDIAASEIRAVLEQHRRQGGRAARRPAA